MNYLQKNNHRNSSAWKSIVGVVLVLGLAGIFYFFLPNFLTQTLYGVATPVWNSSEFVKGSFAAVWSMFDDKAKLESENAALLLKLSIANVALTTLDDYKRENDTLKTLLGRTNGEKSVLASVLSRPGHTAYDSFVVDAGKNDGVKKGDLVLVQDFAIGTVEEVFNRYAKISLFSSFGESVLVRVGTSGVDTEALGRGAGNFSIKLPKEILVKPGDVIKSTGLYPKFYGVVGDVEQTETSAFQSILFTLPVNLNIVDQVLILSSEE
ncbi:MAG: rod shape-determining protein MreC [Patescibacteria group bacterium]